MGEKQTREKVNLLIMLMQYASKHEWHVFTMSLFQMPSKCVETFFLIFWKEDTFRVTNESASIFSTVYPERANRISSNKSEQFGDWMKAMKWVLIFFWLRPSSRCASSRHKIGSSPPIWRCWRVDGGRIPPLSRSFTKPSWRKRRR